MKVITSLTVSLLISIYSIGQIKEFKISITSDSIGYVKVFWTGNSNGNKEFPYKNVGENLIPNLKWQSNDNISSLKVYFYFPNRAEITIHNVELKINENNNILYGNGILRVAGYNHQTYFTDVNNKSFSFRKFDRSGYPFLVFNSSINNNLFRNDENKLASINFYYKSDTNFIAQSYAYSIENFHGGNKSTIVFLPNSNNRIANLSENVELTNDKKFILHINSETPVYLNLKKIGNIEDKVSYSDSSLYQRIQVSNNLTLCDSAGIMSITRNGYDSSFGLIQLNLSDKLDPNLRYDVNVYAKNIENSIIKVSMSNDNEHYSYNNYVNGKHGKTSFKIFSDSPLRSLVVYIKSPLEIALDSVIVKNDRANEFVSLKKEDFDFKTDETKTQHMFYKKGDFLFVSELYKHNIKVLLLIYVITIASFIINKLLMIKTIEG